MTQVQKLIVRIWDSCELRPTRCSEGKSCHMEEMVYSTADMIEFLLVGAVICMIDPIVPEVGTCYAQNCLRPSLELRTSLL
jgi:hypothetical protein